MKKLKVITVVGTRPEIIRLSSVIKKLEIYCEHTLVHTGQNYDNELSNIFFNELDIKKPDFTLKKNQKSNPINSISEIFKFVDDIIKKKQPDAFIVLGDTNSCLSAYCAKRAKIPIFHIEAGNRSFDLRVPEEINRKIVDHLADVNITYSNFARENLLRENFPEDKLFKIGSPLFEVFKNNKTYINRSNILKKLKLKKNNFYVCSIHREENLDNSPRFKKILNFLNELTSQSKYPIIFSTHPRTKEKIKNTNILKNKKIIFCKPFGYFDYMKLQINSKLVLSDSGSITEESSICDFRAINLRQSYERQEGLSYGGAPLNDFNYDRFKLLERFMEKKVVGKVQEYETENFSNIFLNILMSYVDHVNFYTWKKIN